MTTYSIREIPFNNAYGTAYEVWMNHLIFVGTFTRRLCAEAWITEATR